MGTGWAGARQAQQGGRLAGAEVVAAGAAGRAPCTSLLGSGLTPFRGRRGRPARPPGRQDNPMYYGPYPYPSTALVLTWYYPSTTLVLP